jgi:hypothetical protein
MAKMIDHASQFDIPRIWWVRIQLRYWNHDLTQFIFVSLFTIMPSPRSNSWSVVYYLKMIAPSIRFDPQDDTVYSTFCTWWLNLGHLPDDADHEMPSCKRRAYDPHKDRLVKFEWIFLRLRGDIPYGRLIRLSKLQNILHSTFRSWKKNSISILTEANAVQLILSFSELWLMPTNCVCCLV